MSRRKPSRCESVDPVWDRRCELAAGHAGVHRNAETPGDAVTWGRMPEVRAYVRGGGDGS